MINPLYVLLAALVPFLLLAQAGKIYPRALLVSLFLAVGVVSAVVGWWPALVPLVLAIDAAIVLFALIDLATLPRQKHFAVRREHLRIASLRKPQQITLTVENRSGRRQELVVRDGVPERLIATPPQLERTLPPKSRATIAYSLKATRRGAFTLPAVFLSVQSRFGCWRRIYRYPHESQVFVYPDMRQLAEYSLLARTNRLSQVGVRRTRKIGQDNEFERLRDFTRDDNFKHIDWRSTARRSKLTVKDFQANHSQRVVFLVDCGRMMVNEAQGLSLLDHAFNAALMLSYVALKQGDAVGMVCFSEQVHSSVMPKSGAGQMNRLLHTAFDRFPQMVESRYDEAFLHLNSHCRKRSLVVLITNVIDEVNANQILRYTGRLVGHHLPLVVLLRDRGLFDAVADDSQRPDPDTGVPALFRAAAAADVLTWRQQVLADLTAKGVLALDVFPEQLTAPLVNSYLEIKARHLL
jgi:uncharacterized protein (DUF58 family)